ncbi:unnamed protein product [Durusdinium trenchii]|uniref:Carrier domain-containing protein n=1 Tax=Durusdinium trenchii TaxID=1381693 RepID=A0ABP0HDS5_9DINO
MSYQDLAEQSHQMARGLRRCGTRAAERAAPGSAGVPGAACAVWMPKSRWVVITALAILETGGIYVPCDERLPWGRVANMVSLAAVKVLVAGEHQLRGIPDGLNEELLITTAEELFEDQDGLADGDDWCHPRASEDSTAYVIFTSGSTGQPKGVAVTHRSIVHLVDWVNSTYQITSEDSLLFVTSIGFDLSCYDMFGSLAAGSTIHMARNHLPEKLLKILTEQKITFWNSAPQVFSALGDLDGGTWRKNPKHTPPRSPEVAVSSKCLPAASDAGSDGSRVARQMPSHASGLDEALKGLRLIFLSGDWIPLALARKILAGARSGAVQPDVKLVALGGATEVTVWSNYFEVEEVDSAWRSIPYGRPIWNHQYYCLSDASDVMTVHLGMTGQLYIGGVGVAEGYVGRPDLTAERFRTNPFRHGRPLGRNDRLYHTGDVVRFMPLKPWGVSRISSGRLALRADEVVLEFLGRCDSQVKIRGFRVEVTEVEEVIRQLGAEAAVLALPGVDSDLELVGFLVGTEADLKRVKEGLGDLLPSYMIPELACLDELPLSANGKLDRSQLQRQRRTCRAQRAAAGEAARSVQPPAAEDTEIVLRVATAFQEILGLDAMPSMDVNFFELGGHSLSAMQLQRVLETGSERGRGSRRLSLREVFQHPTVAGLAKLLAEENHTDSHHSPREKPPLLSGHSRENDGGGLPASFAQERLWLEQHLLPGPSYNVPFAWRVTGVSHLHLAAAIVKLLRRHEILRTVLLGGVSQDGKLELSQEILPLDVEIPLDMLAARNFLCPWFSVERADSSAAAELMREDAVKGFELDRGVMRARLFAVGEEEFLLYFNIHHVAFDAASQVILEKELCMDLLGKQMPEEGSRARYVDYAQWHRRWLEEGEAERCLRYWRKKLVGAPLHRPWPQLVTDSGSSGATVISTWPAPVSGALRALARRHGSSEMVLMLSLFGLLLSIHLGEDLLVGIPEAGRSGDPQLDDIIGFFVNTLPIRLSCPTQATFKDLLERTQATLLEAIEHSALPFQAVADLRQEKGHQGGLQAFFQHTHDVTVASELLEPFDFGTWPALAKFEVSLHTSLDDQGGRLRWEFMPEVVPHSFVKLLDRHLAAMAERLASNTPGALCMPLWRLREPPWDLRHAVLHDWTASVSPPLPECRLEDLLEQQAKRTPQQTAVLCVEASQRLSYRELLEESQELAEILIKIYDASGSSCAPTGSCSFPAAPVLDVFRVGLLTERGLDLPVMVFAVLTAGGAFVPLSPDFPAERLKWISQDAQVAVLLATPSTAEPAALLASAFHPVLPLHVVSARSRSTGRLRRPTRRRRTRARSSAYVLFTSGSTGRPKGVVVSQQALVSHLMPYLRVLKLTAGDKVLLTSSFTFDMAYSQLFGALLSGAQLIITSENPMIDPEHLRQILYEQQISFTTLVPSVLSFMNECEMPFPLPLRHLGCGGEALASKALLDFFQSARNQSKSENPVDVQVHNRYGPTECAINALLLGPFSLKSHGTRCSKVEAVPIGWPSGSRQIWIQGFGLEKGELVLAGAGLALGYTSTSPLRRGPFAENLRGAGRCYGSGDMAARALDELGTLGCVSFCGRSDAQVKLHGQRIELGEIEQAILECPEALLHCAKLLPRAMIPSFHWIAGWPRSSSGKIDLQALASRAVAHPAVVSDGEVVPGVVLPRMSEWSGLEGQVQVLMKTLAELGLGDTSPSSRVSSLGLNSLLALRVSRNCAQQGVKISLQRLLGDGTVEDAIEPGDGLDPIEEGLELLLGRTALEFRLLGSDLHGEQPWELLLCPGDGGVGLEGYRPLALALNHAAGTRAGVKSSAWIPRSKEATSSSWHRYQEQAPR